MSPEPTPAERWGVAMASAALAACAYSVALIEPRLGLPMVLGTGLPLALCRLRVGRAAGLLAIGLVTALVAGLFAPGHALFLLLLVALPAWVMSESLAAGHGILAASLRAAALLGLWISLFLLAAGPSARELLTDSLDQYSSQAFREEMLTDGFPQQQVEEFQQGFARFRSAIEIVYPAVYLLIGWSVALLAAGLLRAWLARRGPHWLEGPGFEDLRLPFGLVAVFLVAGVSVLSPPLRPLAYNALLLVGFLYGLQGLAVAVYYAGRVRGPRLLRSAIVVLMLLIPFGAQLLALAGLFDNFFDFRRWADPPSAGAGGVGDV